MDIPQQKICFGQYDHNITQARGCDECDVFTKCMASTLVGAAPPHPVKSRSKYHREIKPGVFVDVYDVLHAWSVTNPALAHLVKKALQPGERGHKTKAQDMQDIVDSAIRAQEMEA